MREIREAKGVSAEELARKMGVSSVTIYRYEQGNRAMTADKIAEAADALNVEPGALFQAPLVGASPPR
jgi:transcriptional regulator with XRE-family HTH domain